MAALRQLVRFLLLLLIALVMIGALVVLYGYVSDYDPGRASEDGRLVGSILDAVRSSFLGAFLLAATISLFSVLRTDPRPFFSLILLTVIWCGLLVGGSVLMRSHAQEPDPLSVVFAEHTVTRIGAVRIFPSEIRGVLLSPLAIHDPAKQPGFYVASEAVLDAAGQAIRVPGMAGGDVDITGVRGSYSEMVRPTGYFVPILADIAGVTSLLAAGPEDGRSPGLLTALALGLFLLGCWTLVRLTRWPACNALLVVGAIRLAVWFVASVNGGSLSVLIGGFVDPNQLWLVSAGVLAGVAVALAAMLILLPPLSSWKREVGNG